MIPRELIEFIKSKGYRRTYPKGAVILHQGEPLDGVYLIISGYASLYDIDKYGSSRIAVIYPKDYILPVSWLLKEKLDTGARFSYSALTDIECYKISRSEVHAFLRAHPLLYSELLDMITKGYINSLGRIYNLQKSSATEKIEYIIHFFAMAYGKPREDGLIELSPAFTHQKIADFAGLTREAVSRELTKPRFKSVFTKTGNKILINLDVIKSGPQPIFFRISHDSEKIIKNTD